MRDPAPQPPPALLDELGSLRPVRTRVPARALALAVAGSLGWALAVLAGPIAWLSRAPIRRDLASLPRPWLVGVAALWALGFGGSLAAALLPPRGQVAPRAYRAAGWAAATVAGAFVTALGLQHLGPGGVGGLGSGGGCLATSSLVAAGPLALGLFALKRAVPLGERAIGAAVGAAGGALGGLVLLAHCPLVDLRHLALGHAVPVLLAALGGALAARRLLVP